MADEHEEWLRSVGIPHLRTQFARARPILFTGAGFSLAARAIGGGHLPTAEQLKEAIWNLVFPGTPVSPNASLQDVYDAALLRARRDLIGLLQKRLSVDADTLPRWYETYFALPWRRSYTLNVDNLELAALRAFPQARGIRVISATEPEPPAISDARLQVIHLNGTLEQVPDDVRFSRRQYAERLGRPDPWYSMLVADLLSHPCIFIGTALEEPSLWEHIELRGPRGDRSSRELRPKSYLVSPSLDEARAALLETYNVTWLPMTAEAFAEYVLHEMLPVADDGYRILEGELRGGPRRQRQVPDVAQLLGDPNERTDYLLGAEPVWADLQSGRAISRESDETVWDAVKTAFGDGEPIVVVITGTAGAGKSTALMRLALRLTSDGSRVAWVDRDSEHAPADLRACTSGDDAPAVLALDDADLYGSELASIVREAAIGSKSLPIVALRSGRVDRYLPPALLEGVKVVEVAMPPLEDSDIDGLIDTLDRENRLGALKNVPREQQQRVFREQAGRQLLIAMIQATSGKRFKEKAVDELYELEPRARIAYGLIAVATHFRFDLSRADIVLASGDQTNETLNFVDQLERRKLILASRRAVDAVRTRHRHLADVLVEELQNRSELAPLLQGLVFLAATRVRAGMRHHERPARFLRALLNHEFLFRSVGVEAARNIYGIAEPALNWEYNYWLQRGSLEVESGDLSLAENFLSQARNLAPDNRNVANEWAYLLWKRALAHPTGDDAESFVRRATEILEELIATDGGANPHPYHVLGSQGLAWCRRAVATPEAKGRLLQRLIRTVEDGLRKHPTNGDLQALLPVLRRELMELAVVPRSDGA